ncbi:MAG: hypothetical protein QGH20_07745, partial [Candidatus Latescibacteria bacterium]|nr:hypothetical protein [Candidatus Latescibacterota bacterium]
SVQQLADDHSSFTIESPVAVAATRGTEWAMTVDGNDATVSVLSGRVGVSPKWTQGTETLVNAGQELRMKIGDPIPPARRMSRARQRELQNWMGEPVPNEPPPIDEQQDGQGDSGGAPEPQQGDGGGEGFGMSGAIGAATIRDESGDEVLVNQISFRPEFRVGKLGVALDIPLYFDVDGNFQDQYWDEPADLLDKIYYVRWGQLGDSFYVRAGAVDNVTLGYGLIMSGYNNALNFPTDRLVGIHTGIQWGPVGVEGMLADIRKHDLYGGRLSFKAHRFLEIGISAVSETREYGIGPPMGVALEESFNVLGVDGDSTMVQWSDVDGAVDAFGADIAIPIIRRSSLTLIFYGQASQLVDHGLGIVPFGARFIAGPFNARLEYRIFEEEFLSEYFDPIYETTRRDSQSTKEALLYQMAKSKGIYGDASMTLFGRLTATAIFQNLTGDGDTKIRSFSAIAEANTQGVIPKVNSAIVYYRKINGFNFWKRDDRLVWGFKIGYELSPGVTILTGQQTTYVPNPDVPGDFIPISTPIIETRFSF